MPDVDTPRHVRTIPDDVVTVEFERDWSLVEVCIIEEPTDSVWWRCDGEQPDIEVTGSQSLPAVLGASCTARPGGSGPTTVKLTSAGSVLVTVRGLA